MAPPPAKRQKTTATQTPAARISASKPSSARDKLYAACLKNGGIDKVWTPEDLLALGVIKSQPVLLATCQELMNASLFQAMDTGNGQGAAFKLRARTAANKYSSLADGDAVEVYRHIEHAGIQGVWKLTLKKRTGIHENKIEKILKGLCGSKHIKQLRGVRSGAKKTYLLYELEPAKEVTGGAWYSDGDLDAGFIDMVANLALSYVKAQSWQSGPRLPNVRNVPRVKARDRPRGSDDDSDDVLTRDEAEAELRMRVATDRKGRILLPFPPDHPEYPTAGEILDKIVSGGLLRDKNISNADMDDLFARLLFDGRIERVGTRPRRKRRRPAASADSDDDGYEESDDDDDDDDAVDEDGVPMYRWVLRPDAWSTGDQLAEVSFTRRGWSGRLGPGNGFSEVPCSKCPVFALCEEGGPVDAKSCAYFADWF